MQILHGTFGLVGEHIAVPDVHAAGEGDFSVHDEHFAMVAQIDGGHPPRRQQRRRQEPGEGNFRVAQSPRDGRPRITRAGGVNQHAHFDAAFDGAGQRGDKFFSGGVVVKNVSRERDGFLRGFDGGEHGGKGFIAVDQGLDLIARQQRPGDDAVDDPREHFQMFGAFMFRLRRDFPEPGG